MKTMRRMLFLLNGLLLFSTLSSHATMEFFVIEKDPWWTDETNSYSIRMADGSLAPTGLIVQLLSSDIEWALSPPTTNEARYIDVSGDYCYGYRTEPDVKYSHLGGIKCYVGDDYAHQGYPAGEGCVSAFLQGDDDWYGWLRIFSAPTIDSAAFYCDTETRLLELLGEFNDSWTETNFFINVVNPAYKIPGFSVATAFTSLHNHATLAISGHVDTVATSDNYRLSDNTVTVMWWCVAVTNHLTHATVTNSGAIPVFGGGIWTGQIDIVRHQPFDEFGTTNTITLRAVGASARPGFPASPDITITSVTVVPEPHAALLTVLVLAAARRRSTRTTPRIS